MIILINSEFEDFYNSLATDEQKDLSVATKAGLVRDRNKVLHNLYLKEACKFIYEQGKSEYGVGVAETLIQYLLNGELRLCSPQEYVYPNKNSIGESILYSDFINRKCIGFSNYFAKSSLHTFFSDLVAYVGGQFNSGVFTNIVDFNLMLHIYIMKTRALKNNTNLWNGVDISECKDLSLSTGVGFKVFRFQYNQQIVNETTCLIRMLINSLTIPKFNGENSTSLGMLDHVALDLMSSRYRFDNLHNIVEPDMYLLYTHNRKILREYEGRATQSSASNNQPPKLKVYLCSSNSVKYVLIKFLASRAKCSFFDMMANLAHIDGWDTLDEDFIGRVAKVIGCYKMLPQSLDKRIMLVEDGLGFAQQQQEVGIIDEDFYNTCKEFYIPNMEFVVYTWNNHVFEPVSSEVEIDFNKVLEQGEGMWDYLIQLYHAGQRINLLRRVLIDDSRYFRVTVKNVPLEYAQQVDKLLQEETKNITSKYNDKFNYMYTLDNTKWLQEAKKAVANRKENPLKRDEYLLRFKNTKRTTWVGKKVHRRVGFKVNQWKIQRNPHLGKLKVVKELQIPRVYFDFKELEDEKN